MHGKLQLTLFPNHDACYMKQHIVQETNMWVWCFGARFQWVLYDMYLKVQVYNSFGYWPSCRVVLCMSAQKYDCFSWIACYYILIKVHKDHT